MNDFTFRAAETACPLQADSSQETAPDCLRSRDETDDDRSLSAVDRVIRSFCARSSPDVTLADGTVFSDLGGHHPDSPDVLRWCRRRHPEWADFPEQTICAVYQRFLCDRWAMAVLWRIANEAPATVDRVLANIARLSPDGCDDDSWWVWRQLVIYDPANSDYEYSDAAIRRAWRAVRSLRARWDGTGRAHGRTCAARRRRKAIARLTADFALSATALEAIDIDDYCAFEGTLARRGPTATVIYHLSAPARKTLDSWLRLRGFGAGCLFELSPMARRMSLEGLLAKSDGRGLTSRDPDVCAAVEAEDFVEHLCAGLGEVAHAFVLEVMVDDGGWPVGVMRRFEAACPSFSGTGPAAGRLTKQQRWRGRAELKERAAHLGIDHKAARTTSSHSTPANGPIAKNGPSGQDKWASGAGPSLQ